MAAKLAGRSDLFELCAAAMGGGWDVRRLWLAWSVFGTGGFTAVGATAAAFRS